MADILRELQSLSLTVDVQTPQLVNGIPICFLNTVEGVAAAVKLLSEQSEPSVAVDLEGVDLGREGRVATLQLCGSSGSKGGAMPTTYVVDVGTLGPTAFSAEAGLRALLESEAVTKLFFDVRSDASALFHHYGISMPASAVIDLQLLDICHNTRKGQALRRLNGLSYLLENVSGVLDFADRCRMTAIKEQARKLFSPECGGSFNVWLARPLSPLLLEYTADVRYFHGLRAALEGGALDVDAIRDALLAAVQRRLTLVYGPTFSSRDQANTEVDTILVAAVEKTCSDAVQRQLKAARVEYARLLALPLRSKIRERSVRRQALAEALDELESARGAIAARNLWEVSSYVAAHDQWFDPSEWREFMTRASNSCSFTLKQRATMAKWLSSGGPSRRRYDDTDSDWLSDNEDYSDLF